MFEFEFGNGEGRGEMKERGRERDREEWRVRRRKVGFGRRGERWRGRIWRMMETELAVSLSSINSQQQWVTTVHAYFTNVVNSGL